MSSKNGSALKELESSMVLQKAMLTSVSVDSKIALALQALLVCCSLMVVKI